MYLMHHGVKGQQWGVRHGPPYPIEDKIMRKGTRLNSVSSYAVGDDYLKTGKPVYTYNPDDEWDSAVYKGPFSYYLYRNKGAMFVKEHQFEVIKDLKMPTRKERIQEFKDLYADKKFSKDLKHTLTGIQNYLIKYNVGSTPEMLEKIKKVNVNKLGDKDWDAAYEIFGHAMEAQHAYKSTSEYMKRLSKKYDAMVDDNNQGIYNDAHDPVVIFKANESLRALNNMDLKNSLVDGPIVMENFNKVEKKLASEGKHVKL